MVSQAELDRFFEGLVTDVRVRGIELTGIAWFVSRPSDSAAGPTRVGGWLIEDAKQSASQLLVPGALEWLPNITEHFFGLRSEPA